MIFFLTGRLAARDAAVADPCRCAHIQRHHQCVREGLAVDGIRGLAARISVLAYAHNIITGKYVTNIRKS